MLTFVKLGGSLITDKHQEASFRHTVVASLAQEIHDTLNENRELRLLIGHGSGSFGHFAAHRHQTMRGVKTEAQWRGFAEVAAAAGELNTLVAKTFHSAGVPVWAIQPSASAMSSDGRIENIALHPIQHAIEHELVPLVYGDVSLDRVRGGTIISTESIFFYLAQYLPVTRVLLLGEVEGVLSDEKQLISEITPANYPEIKQMLRGSDGVDVTGGMSTKVQDMLALVTRLPHLSIRICDGTVPDLLKRTLLGQAHPGTVIKAVG